MIGSILIVLDTNNINKKLFDDTKRKCILKNYQYDFNIQNLDDISNKANNINK